MTRIAHAVRAEDGTKDGVIPGDQDGKEVRIQTYYAKNDAGKPWEHVLRARDPALAERIAVNMIALKIKTDDVDALVKELEKVRDKLPKEAKDALDKHNKAIKRK